MPGLQAVIPVTAGEAVAATQEKASCFWPTRKEPSRKSQAINSGRGEEASFRAGHPRKKCEKGKKKFLYSPVSGA